MKVAVVLILVAACVATSYSAPATNAVDWEAVCAKLEQLKDLVKKPIELVKNIAYNDNAAIGDIISSQLEAAAGKALALIEEAIEKCKAHTLTAADFLALIGQLQDILAGVQNDLQDELAQLSSGASAQIRDVFYSSYAQVELMAQEVYALLLQ